MESNYSSWDINEQDFFSLSSKKEQLDFLVCFALLAPSSHNAQPWSFHVQENSISILPNLQRSLPISDPFNRHLYIALGCALENLLIAAHHYGFKTKVEYCPQEEVAARVIFLGRGESEKGARLINAIVSRESNRSRYKEKVPQKFVEWLAGFSVPGIEISAITDRSTREKLASVLISSRIKAFSCAPFRQEMSSYKRNNWTHEYTGMPGFTMNFNPAVSLIAGFLIKNFNVMKVIQKREMESLTRYSPLFIFVCSREHNKEAWLRAGQSLEHILVEATAQGVSTSMGAVPPDTTPLQEIVSMPRPQMFVRAGYARKILGHSPRLPREQVIS